MNVTFRHGTTDDLAQIMELVENAVKNMETQEIMQWDALYPVMEDFAEDVSEGTLFVGTQDKKIVVICTVNQKYDNEYENGQWQQPLKSFAVIHRLCVNPDFQNKGIAYQTMHFIETLVKEKGIEAVRLDVFSKNPYALRLYQKCGYQEVGTVQWRKGIFYLMEKYL